MKLETFSEKLYSNPAKGALCLVPTPLEEDGRLDPLAFDILLYAATEKKSESIFVIEDLKPGRKRWLAFGLPRDCVEDFVLYNEHTSAEASKSLLAEIQKGKKVFLMSDGGTPAFYDPGVELVRLCHQHKQLVTSTPLANSVALALALSGFSHKKFWFEGFLPMDSSERKTVLTSLLKQKHTSILMDTPYRMKRVLEEFNENWSGQGNSKSKRIFLAMDLCSDTEELRLGTPSELLVAISDYKREFVLVLSE